MVAPVRYSFCAVNGCCIYNVIWLKKIKIRTCENSIQKWQHCIARYSSCSVVSCFDLYYFLTLLFSIHIGI